MTTNPPLTLSALNTMRSRASTAKTRADALEALSQAKPTRSDHWVTLAMRVLLQQAGQLEGTPVFNVHRPPDDPDAHWVSARCQHWRIIVTPMGITVVDGLRTVSVPMKKIRTDLPNVLSSL